MRTASLVAAVALVVSTPASAADLSVGTGQTYSTIQSAVDAASPGDTILVQSGEYGEQLGLSQDGTQALPITLTAAADATVILNGFIDLDGDYWRITDLEVVVPSGERGITVKRAREAALLAQEAPRAWAGARRVWMADLGRTDRAEAARTAGATRPKPTAATAPCRGDRRRSRCGFSVCWRSPRGGGELP